MSNQLNKALLRVRPLPLPLRTKPPLLNEQVIEELRRLCEGRWEFLHDLLLDRRMDDEDQAMELRSALKGAWSNFVVTRRDDWRLAVSDLADDLARVFASASGQHRRWRHTKWFFSRASFFFDRLSLDRSLLKRLLIGKRDYAQSGEASMA